MSEKVLNTRIQLKYDTLTNWQNESVAGKGANLVLKSGEMGICYVPARTVGVTEYAPTVLFKVGDGTTSFKNLPWASGHAADVYQWAKAENRPTYAYGDSDLTGFGSAAAQDADAFDESGAAADALIEAKEYTDEAISGISGTDTQYQIVISGTTMKLQSKEKNTGSWSDIAGQSWDLNTVLKGQIAEGNTGFVVGDDVFDALALKQDTLSFEGTYNASTNKVALKSTVTEAVAAEAERATGVESGLDSRLTTAESDIDTLEGKVETIEGKPAYSITSQQVSNWNNEVGAKAAVEQEVTDRNTAITNAIGALDYTDSAVTGKYVSAVSEVDGVISVVRADLPAATVTGVKSGDKILELDGTELTSTLSISYDSTDRKVQLKGIDGEIVSEFDASAFIKDGMLYGETSFVADATSKTITLKGQSKTFDNLVVGHQYLVFLFTDGAVPTPTYSWDIVDLQNLVDVYTAGNGITIQNNVVSAKIKENDSYIEVTANGIASKGIDSAISTAVSEEETRALEAEGILDDKIDEEIARASGAEGDLADRLDVIEGADTVNGSIKKALKDAKDYTDTAIADKADKVSGAVSGNFAGLDANGNLTDSGKKAADFVAVEAGKGLSTNDFTNAYKTKLDGISTGANKVESSTTNGYIKIDGTETKVYTLPADVVKDSAYKHITVTTNTVSDGTTTLTLPTELKNPNSLTIGDKSYDGSAPVEISAEDIGDLVELADIATTGNVNDLVQTSGDVLVFNCGNSTTVL